MTDRIIGWVALLAKWWHHAELESVQLDSTVSIEKQAD